jgi:putative ABC transport system substrate-binding protein
MFGLNAEKLAPVVAKSRLPSMFGTRSNVEAGALMSYGPDLANLNRQAAIYVDKILKGAKPAELPVEQPTKFELVINLKTAKALGVTIPQALLLRANQILE